MDTQHPWHRFQTGCPILNSILTRLLAWQIGTMIITACFVTALTYQLSWSEFNRSRDMSLEQIAWAVMRHQGMHPELFDLSQEQHSIISQVWDGTGRLIYASRPDMPLPRQKNGLSSFTWQELEWHAVVIEDNGTFVQVANTADARALWFREFGASLTVPLLVMVIIMGSFIAIAATQAFQPIRQLSREIQQRSPAFLSPLSRQQYPDELLVIIDALNEMFRRLDKAFLARQRFIADAAHELRTPLTAVQLNAEVARNETHPATRDAALDNLSTGINRASHLVNQLLHLAKFDPQFIARRRLTTVDVVALATTVIIERDVLAAVKNIDIGLVNAEPVHLHGDPEALHILLSNLIDNAIHYSGTASHIDIAVSSANGQARIAVIDHGPGIAEGDRERVFEAFCRLGSTMPGSGLGLAISQEIVHQHHGTISLDDTPGGGLTVHISLPINPA